MHVSGCVRARVCVWMFSWAYCVCGCTCWYLCTFVETLCKCILWKSEGWGSLHKLWSNNCHWFTSILLAFILDVKCTLYLTSRTHTHTHIGHWESSFWHQDFSECHISALNGKQTAFLRRESCVQRLHLCLRGVHVKPVAAFMPDV